MWSTYYIHVYCLFCTDHASYKIEKIYTIFYYLYHFHNTFFVKGEWVCGRGWEDCLEFINKIILKVLLCRNFLCGFFLAWNQEHAKDMQSLMLQVCFNWYIYMLHIPTEILKNKLKITRWLMHSNHYHLSEQLMEIIEHSAKPVKYFVIQFTVPAEGLL